MPEARQQPPPEGKALEALMAGARHVTTFAWPQCTAIEFFGAFFADGSDFQRRTHEKRGDRNCSCERWAPVAAGFHSRERRFTTGYKTPLGELGSCAENWCEFSVGKRSGFVEQRRLWGAGEP